MSVLLTGSPRLGDEGAAGRRPPALHDGRVSAEARHAAAPADLVCSPEVAEALDAGAPVVALESTLLAHGLPRPDNRAAADEVEAAVRSGGSVPATIAGLDGVPHVGLTDRKRVV